MGVQLNLYWHHLSTLPTCPFLFNMTCLSTVPVCARIWTYPIWTLPSGRGFMHWSSSIGLSLMTVVSLSLLQITNELLTPATHILLQLRRSNKALKRFLLCVKPWLLSRKLAIYSEFTTGNDYLKQSLHLSLIKSMSATSTTSCGGSVWTMFRRIWWLELLLTRFPTAIQLCWRNLGWASGCGCVTLLLVTTNWLLPLPVKKN